MRAVLLALSLSLVASVARADVPPENRGCGCDGASAGLLALGVFFLRRPR